MRTNPMTVAEGCDLQRRMLEHFSLLPPSMSSSEALKPAKARRLSRRAVQALEASDIFLQLADDWHVHNIRNVNDAISEIRYSMGFSWLAWLIARQFLTALIRWLWEEYHKLPESPTGESGVHESRQSTYTIHSDLDAANSELRLDSSQEYPTA